MNRRLFFAGLLYLIMGCVLFPNDGVGQDTESRATLLGWEQRIRNFMLDRSHNFGGTHFSRGLFREHLTQMSPEHNIDLLTYRYTLMDDYQWQQKDNAYRLSTGSLNATDFAIENVIKSNIEVTGQGTVTIEGYHTENFRANRFLFHLGYKHNLGGAHQIGIRHTLTKEKSDLDATFFYRYGNIADGMVKAEFTVMDWGSNTVQGLAEGSRHEWNQRYEVTHQYLNSPELLSLTLVSPAVGHVKAQVLGGLQTYSRKRVEEHSDANYYRDEEWAHYVGGLLEYARPRFTVGLTYQRTFSKLKRSPVADSNYDLQYGNWQITNNVGFYAAGRLKYFRLEQWVWYGHNTDRLQGAKVPAGLNGRHPLARIPFNFEEKPVTMKSRFFYDPLDSGLKVGLEFHAEYVHPQGEKAANGIRNYDFRRIYPIIKDYNERLTWSIGYRFSANFYLLAGISYDVDGDKQSGIGHPKVEGVSTWFDGGFGRFSISW